MMRRFAAVLSTLVLISACAPQTSNVTRETANNSATSGDMVTGAQLYTSTCSACHGPQARGIPGLGKDLVNSTLVDSLDQEALRDFIVTGRRPWDAANTTGVDMPGRGGNPSLTDEQISHIIAYLRSLK